MPCPLFLRLSDDFLNVVNRHFLASPELCPLADHHAQPVIDMLDTSLFGDPYQLGLPLKCPTIVRHRHLMIVGHFIWYGSSFLEKHFS